ncbi:MAG: ABC transporter permease subunit [Planctomycetaceae bacterium]
MNETPRTSSTVSAKFLLPLTVLLAAIGTWQLLIVLTNVSPIVVPTPASVAAASFRMVNELSAATLRTAAAAGMGLAGSSVLGVLTAFGFAQSKLVRMALYPYAILLQTVPIIAVAPIVIISFGRGFHSVALVALIISVFPVITSTTTGLLQVDANLLDLFRLHSATWWQLLFRLRMPSALPYIISGVRIASGTAVVGAIVGEFFVGSSQPGLGALIQQKSAGFLMDELYATVICSAALGVAFFATITLGGETLLNRRFGTSLEGRR